jgi:uncharacterized protein
LKTSVFGSKSPNDPSRTMIAWVTGGGTGIGRAIAAALAQRGDQVLISGRRENVLRATAAELSQTAPHPVLAAPGDVSDPELPERVRRSLPGPVDLLVNNAGLNHYKGTLETTSEEYLESFKVNCLGSIQCAKAVLPEMRRRNSGGIILISSIYGRWGSKTSAAYSISKYAVAGLTDVLRQDVVGSGIHVMGVFPGFIWTDMTAPFVAPGSLRSKMGQSPESIARAILRAFDRRRPELYFPWYVSWAIRFHRWCPIWADQLAVKLRR